MSIRTVFFVIAGIAVGYFPLGGANATAEPAGQQATAEDVPDVDAQADRILREMGEYLSDAQEYSFQADVAYDTETAEDQTLQYGGVARVAVGRPDRLHARYDGDERKSQVIINGQTFTFYDARANVYATAEVSSDMDEALDRAFELYGFSVPIADLVYSDPYGTLIENVERGFVVGRHGVDGVPCHHLAFSQESIDWQIWIEDGPQPVPRKLVITYKTEPDSPQYVARLSKWNFHPRFSKHYFDFHAPAGSGEMEFLTVETTPKKEVQP